MAVGFPNSGQTIPFCGTREARLEDAYETVVGGVVRWRRFLATAVPRKEKIGKSKMRLDASNWLDGNRFCLPWIAICRLLGVPPLSVQVSARSFSRNKLDDDRFVVRTPHAPLRAQFLGCLVCLALSIHRFALHSLPVPDQRLPTHPSPPPPSTTAPQDHLPCSWITSSPLCADAFDLDNLFTSPS